MRARIRDYRQIIAFRNVLIHGYDLVDRALVWSLIENRAPLLLHVLMDSGEPSEEPGNLMRDETSAKSTALTAAQCVRLRDNASGNGLLAKTN